MLNPKLIDFAQTQCEDKDPWDYIALLTEHPEWLVNDEKTDKDKAELLGKFQMVIDKNPYLQELFIQFEDTNQEIPVDAEPVEYEQAPVDANASSQKSLQQLTIDALNYKLQLFNYGFKEEDPVILKAHRLVEQFQDA